MKNVVLIDGNALMHRSYHGVGRGFVPMHNTMPVGMVYGFASTLLNIIRVRNPEVLCVTFDTPEKTFRHEMDEDYKAHRTKAPDDFYPQLPFIFELLEAFSIPTFSVPGYESDDIIGTLAVQSEPYDWNVHIMSGDFDFLQLINERIRFLKFNGKIEDSPEYTPEETFEKFGVYPSQIIDFKALTGDSSDNYKGVQGMGPKTAAKLLSEFGSLDSIYQNLEKLPEKWKTVFKTEKETILHCQKLATIHCDIPLEYDYSDSFSFVPDQSLSFFEKMNFGALASRYKSLYKKSIQLNGKNQPLINDPSQLSLFS